MPGSSARRSADAAVISATTGPTRTRTRFPIGATETTAASDVIHARVVRLREADGDVPRVDGDVHGPRLAIRAPEEEPVVERHLRQPVLRLDGLAGEERRPREAGDERVRRHRDQLRGRAELQDASLADDADAMCEGRGVLEIVGDDDRRQAQVFEELAKLGAHPGSGVRVQRGQRLVEEEDRRVARKCARQRDALALASRELGDTSTCEVGDTEALEQGVDVVSIPRTEAHVAQDIEVREQRVLLKR